MFLPLMHLYTNLIICKIENRYVFDCINYELMTTKIIQLFIKFSYNVSMHSFRHAYTTLLIMDYVEMVMSYSIGGF